MSITVGCTIHPTATVAQDVYLHRAEIGAHTIVEAHTSVVYAAVGDYCRIGRRAVVEELPSSFGGRVPHGSVLESSGPTEAALDRMTQAGVVFNSTVMWTPTQGTWVKPGCLPWEPIAVTIDRIRSAKNEGFCTRLGCYDESMSGYQRFIRRVDFWAEKLAEWDAHTTSWDQEWAA